MTIPTQPAPFWKSSLRGLGAGLIMIFIASMPPFAHAHRLPHLHAILDEATDSAPTPAPTASPDTKAARLSSVDGLVRVLQDGQVVSDPAVLNQPLFEGAQVETGSNGQAELQFEDGSVARLTPNTVLTIKALRPATGSTALQGDLSLEHGLAYFELQPIQNENGTPSGLMVSFGSTRIGAENSLAVARINFDAPPGQVAALTGSLHLLGNNHQLSLDLDAGQFVQLNADDATQYTLQQTIPADSWDNWNADRDAQLAAEASAQTPATGDNANNPAWGDLDANGSWYNVPGTGYVWSPSDASAGLDWDPYGYGSWVWYPGRGYLWVSGYNWGYLPYTCGNWNWFDGFGWGWQPLGCYGLWSYGSGWGLNIALLPGWYHRPHRPDHPHPGHPGGGEHGHTVGTEPPSHAVVPIDRRVPINSTTDRGSATINGHPVKPLNPIAPRPVYNRTSDGTIIGPRTGGTRSPGYTPRMAPRNTMVPRMSPPAHFAPPPHVSTHPH